MPLEMKSLCCQLSRMNILAMQTTNTRHSHFLVGRLSFCTAEYAVNHHFNQGQDKACSPLWYRANIVELLFLCRVSAALGL